MCWHRGRESREKERGVGGRKPANELITGHYKGKNLLRISVAKKSRETLNVALIKD